MVRDHLQRCRGFIFPGEEDFGIAPVEAMASGRPVLAFARGGATETVIEGRTGVFFSEANAQSLNRALERLEATAWQSEAIAEHARQFSQERFLQAFAQIVESSLQIHRAPSTFRQLVP